MTDDKLTAARRALAQIADLCFEGLSSQSKLNENGSEPTNTECLRIANETLVSIREIAQDAAEATLDKVETRT